MVKTFDGSLICVLARMDSTRLPGKALMELGGRPLLGLVLDRVRRAYRAERVVVATTDRAIDDPIAEFTAQEATRSPRSPSTVPLSLFRGDCDDVAGRILRPIKPPEHASSCEYPGILR